MAGFDLVIDRKVDSRDRAIPNIMVALAVADEGAPMLAQDIPDFLFVFRHYADIPTVFSKRKLSLSAGC